MSVLFWYLFVLLLLLQGYYIQKYFLPLINLNRKTKRSILNVSVIICAKNEEKNLKKNLKHILRQKYETFEVLVMDDHSNDGTSELINSYQKEFPHLTYIKASPEIKDKEGKKSNKRNNIQ